jgi:hypothetical protein
MINNLTGFFSKMFSSFVFRGRCRRLKVQFISSLILQLNLPAAVQIE